ncbi:hypothetical protein [Nocardiopsis sp. NPDC058789]|uniref:hypothetical protein n=1 Tax=Nocardiopsis sp. NPDC058789 TaxID=3346634 RepID=UPI00366BD554
MRKKFAGVLSLAAAAVFASALTAAPVSAATPSPQSHITTGTASDVEAQLVKITAITPAHVRTAPYADAHSVWRMQPGQSIYVSCYVINRHGNVWYRTQGANIHYTYSHHFPSYPGIYKC